MKGVQLIFGTVLSITILIVGDNKPIWMQAEEREENKVGFNYTLINEESGLL